MILTNRETMKHTIENKKVWIAIVEPVLGTEHTLTADQQHCSKCQQFKWVIGGITIDCQQFKWAIDGIIKDRNGDLDTMCPKCLKTEDKVCETRYCPYCNKNAPIKMQACKTCIESVIKYTDELYKICKVASADPGCKCKYCKILERIP